MTLRHLRSSTAHKRPTAVGLSDGQLALAYHADSPGLFFKDTAGAVVKVGPVHVGSTAPNVAPAGSSGNSTGESWLDISGANPVLKIWNGSAWALPQPIATGTVITSADSGTVTSAMIANGAIVNDDINANAAIVDSKLATIATANKVSVAAIDIDGATDIGAALTDVDLILVDDGGGGTNRKAAVTRITDYAFAKVSGDITISSAGAAAIAAGVIVNADINASAAIADTKLATISTAGKVANSATTATNLNTASAIVARDGSGNFSAGTITAALSGNASTASAWATGRTITLTGDVTGVSGSWTGSGNISFATSIAADSIVDADVNASAAIAGTKINPVFGSQAISTTGTITGASLIPTSATVPTNGLYLPAANTVGIATGGVERLRVDSSGILGISSTNATTSAKFSNGHFIEGSSASRLLTLSSTNTNLTLGPTGLRLVRDAAVSAHDIGVIGSYWWDGSALNANAEISLHANGAQSAGNSPGAIIFRTTPAGSNTVSERMRIRSDGNIGIGGTGSGDTTLRNQGPLTGSVTTYAHLLSGVVQSDSTANAFYNRTLAATAAATFTLSGLHHYAAGQSTFGAGSSVTTQYGFNAEANLIGATNNYGFFGNIPSGTGRWNFYAAGTADNYFAGNTGIGGGAVTPTARLHISGSTSVGGIYVESSNSSLAAPAVRVTGKRSDGNTSPAFSGKLVLDQQRTDAAISSSKTLGAIIFGGNYDTTPNFCYPASLIAYAEGAWTSTSAAPTGLAFFTGSVGQANTDVAAGYGTERMRIRSDGNVGIGGTGAGTVTLYNQGAITGGITAYANFTVSTVQSDVTAAAYGYVTQLTTAAATFTLGNLQHFHATGATKGAGSTITTQIGFHANANLTQATNNYGFYGNIASATGRWNFYAAGTAPNYFAGDVRTNTCVTYRSVPTASNTSVTITAASMLDGLRTGTPAANINYTLPTGTNMDAAFQELQTEQAFEWSVINLAAATHSITVVQNTGHTVEGNMVVAANSSGRFLTRKTAANTFITYRIA